MAPLIPTVPLNNGHNIPAIGFGTGTALRGKDATTSVVQAIKGGFNHIDTAQFYQNEESVGIALHEAFHGKLKTAVGDEKIDLEGQTGGKLRREDLWVTTKYNGEGDAEAALDRSLKKLGLSYVDLYLIHHPLVAPDIPKTWAEMERAQEHGKARSIGVSNFNIAQLKLILEKGKIVPTVNQIQFHPYNYHENIELLEFANKHGIRIESYSGLAPITRLPGGKLDNVLASIAKRLGPKVTPAQVIMSWIRAKGVVVVTTTSRKERIQEYLGIFELPPLNSEDITAIDQAGRHPPSVETVAPCVLPRLQSPRLVVLVATVLPIVALYKFATC